jgi:hypothetical protein
VLRGVRCSRSSPTNSGTPPSEEVRLNSEVPVDKAFTVELSPHHLFQRRVITEVAKIFADLWRCIR